MPLSKVKQARRALLEICQRCIVAKYIQKFHTLLYKVPQMTQEEAFTLFMHGLDGQVRGPIRYHMEGDLACIMEMVEKADVWQTKGHKRDKKGKNIQKYGN